MISKFVEFVKDFKFWLLALFVIVLFLFNFAYKANAYDYFGNYNEKSENSDKNNSKIKEIKWLKETNKCPFISTVPPSIIDEMSICFRCHTEENFKPKEPSLKNGYEEKPRDLEFGFEDGKLTHMYYLCSSITPVDFFEIFQYLESHEELPKKLIIDIHNPGGSVMDTWKIVGLVNRYYHKYDIITRQDGMALSAGFVLFLMGEERSCSPNAEFMWHQASYMTWLKSVSASGAQDEAENMDHIQSNIDNWIIERTNGKITKEILKQTMGGKDQEWWFNGREGFKYNVCTELVE